MGTAIVIALIVGFFIRQMEKYKKKQTKEQVFVESYVWPENTKPNVIPYPMRSAAYWTSPVMTMNDIPNLAKHDVLIVDLENMFNNRDVLLALKSLNNNLFLLAYSNPMEIFSTRYQTRPWQNKVIDEIIEKKPEWLLTTVYKKDDVHHALYAKFYPGMLMLNMSSACPKIKGKRYSEWMAEKITSEILIDPIWNGYFMDNGTVNISWLYPGPQEKLDIYHDGTIQNDKFVDDKWKEGVTVYLKTISKFLLAKDKRLNPTNLILSNKGDLNLLELVDGKFFENFPNDYLGDKTAGGWMQCLRNAQVTGMINVFQVSRQELMFGLASSLLLNNVAVAIGQDDAGNFPELEIDLGRPLAKFALEGQIFSREYEKGTVKVNPFLKTGEILMK